MDAHDAGAEADCGLSNLDLLRVLGQRVCAQKGIQCGDNVQGLFGGLGSIMSIGAATDFGAGRDGGIGAGHETGRDLIDGQAQLHIISGDLTGGGHKWPGNPGKTVFPPSWDTDRILNNVADIATDPSSAWT